MTKKQGFLSEKIPDPAKATALLSAEARIHLLAFSLTAICAEAFELMRGDVYALFTGSSPNAPATAGSPLPQTPFLLTFIAVFFLLGVLEHTFRLLNDAPSASLFPLIPTALLLFLIQNIDSPNFLTPAIITAAAARIFFAFIPRRDLILLCAPFVLDAAAFYLRFARGALSGSHPGDKFLFISLAVMTLASLQQLLFARKEEAFPFYYYAILWIILITLPMGQKPIDWTPLVETGLRAVRTVRNAAENISYQFSSIFGSDSYTTGYSSLEMTGHQINGSDTTQLLLRTSELPYKTYTDATTSRKMRVRRTLYLIGIPAPSGSPDGSPSGSQDRNLNKEKLVRFLLLLYTSGTDRGLASLFSQTSEVDIEYVYLDTTDEIVPTMTLPLPLGEGADTCQVSDADTTLALGEGTDTRHKKGYQIHAQYLDIDYGSPYLISLFRNSGSGGESHTSSPERNSGPGSESHTSSPERNSGSEVESHTETESHTLPSYESLRDYAASLYDIDLAKILTPNEYSRITGTDTSDSYLDVSGTTPRMADLASTITRSASNIYDKCKLIESYLRQYSYDTNASGGHNPQSNMSTPEGMSDIADRFLFETKTGYCVHYTSSMVMLLRLAGIPARAARGYRFVYPPEQQETYEVSASCAHTWPEAYLENAGWVPFEPTAAYRPAAEYTWHRKAQDEVADNQTHPAEETPDATDTTESDEAAQDQPTGFSAIRILKIALPVALSIILLLAALVAGTRALSRLRYRRSTPVKRLTTDVALIKKAIRRQSEEDFTDRGLLSDYVNRAPAEMRADIQKVFDIYYRVTYGNNQNPDGTLAAQPTPEENELAKNVRDRLS